MHPVALLSDLDGVQWTELCCFILARIKAGRAHDGLQSAAENAVDDVRDGKGERVTDILKLNEDMSEMSGFIPIKNQNL